jgi:hypothetical protein
MFLVPRELLDGAKQPRESSELASELLAERVRCKRSRSLTVIHRRMQDGFILIR